MRYSGISILGSIDKLWYSIFMQAVEQFAISNQMQAVSKDQSKKRTDAPNGLVSSMLARQRRLERRIVELESQVSTLRRDIWRVEKKQQRAEPPAQPVNNLAGLFG